VRRCVQFGVRWPAAGLACVHRVHMRASRGGGGQHGFRVPALKCVASHWRHAAPARHVLRPVVLRMRYMRAALRGRLRCLLALPSLSVQSRTVRALASVRPPHRCPHLRRDWAHPPTSAPGLGSPLPRLCRDWAHPCHVCAGTGLTPATSAQGLGSPAHVCTGTGLTPATSAPGLGSPLPRLHRDWAHPCHFCAGTGCLTPNAISHGACHWCACRAVARLHGGGCAACPRRTCMAALVHRLSHASCAEQLALYEGAPAVAEAYALHDWPAERAAHTVQAAVHRLAILQACARFGLL
jgi:hypothetical protein